MDKFANNHVLVNRARSDAGLPFLYRSRRLDALAQQHARTMVSKRSVFHSPLLAEKKKTVGGENVLRGQSILQMHRDTMKHDPKGRANILSPLFDEFGMGTAKDKEGRLYLVQLFCKSVESKKKEDSQQQTEGGRGLIPCDDSSSREKKWIYISDISPPTRKKERRIAADQISQRNLNTSIYC